MKKALFGMIIISMIVAVNVAGAKGRGDGPVIYVASQDLYYDSIVIANSFSPNSGPFQQLFVDGDGLWTEFGPGDVGYVGGRWWIDVNENGEMDEGDAFFSCPLLGPGREDPRP